MMNLQVEEVTNGYLVSIRQRIDGGVLTDIAVELYSFLVDPGGVLAGLPRLVQQFTPLRKYVFETMEEVGLFMSGLQEDVDAERVGPPMQMEQPVQFDAEPSPLDPDYMVRAKMAEEAELDLIPAWEEAGLENGDVVSLPAGLVVRTERGEYRVDDDGETAVFCGLSQRTPEVAVLQVKVDGDERVIRIDRHYVTAKGEMNDGE